MIHKDLPKKLRDLIVEKYQSGERYKKISKALDVPLSISGENVAPQTHCKDQEIPPKLTRGWVIYQGKLDGGQQQH